MIVGDSKVNIYSSSSSKFSHMESVSMTKRYGAIERDVDKGQFQESSVADINSARVIFDSEEDLSPKDRMIKMIIESMLEELYGKKVTLEPKKRGDTKTQQAVNTPQNPYKVDKENMELKAIVFQTNEEYYQKESIDFGAKVIFNTPEKSYEMKLDISFSKELYESRSTRLVIGDESFADPLIINFGENINPFDNLSSLKFAFDLNNDGKDELLPYLKKGAGYLVLDKNKDGKVDSGAELFGPKTGDGFEELRAYDDDKSGFIDERDAIFDNLKIWSINEEGKGTLVSLLDANVGAIYLGDIRSGFKYIDGIGSTIAQSKSNSFFIKEDGSGLGVVNSVDVVV